MKNANSFLVKEEKGVVQDFCPGGSETAAYDDAGWCKPCEGSLSTLMQVR